MKGVLSVFVLTLLALPVFAQQTDSVPADKAVVYIVRANPFGALLNFNYYDGDLLIGRFNAGKYIRYECRPGEHIFWARSENRSFVEADLEAGKSYLIEAVPTMGAVKAGVRLIPFDPEARRIPRCIRKLVTRRGPEVFPGNLLALWESNSENRTENGLKRYFKLSESGRKMPQLSKNMAIEVENLRWEKKGQKSE